MTRKKQTVMAIAMTAGLCLAGSLACTSGDRSGPIESETSSAEMAESRLAELTGSLRLLQREYDAAFRDGKLADEFEYQEASMAVRQAGRLWKGLLGKIPTVDPATAEAWTKDLDLLRNKVEGKVPPKEVTETVARLLPQMESHLGDGGSELVRATRSSVRAADAEIVGEKIVDNYRFGITYFAPRTLFSWKGDAMVTTPPGSGDTHFVGVVLREKGTKRALPASRVTLTMKDGAPIELHEIWGDYQFYGANVAVPEGTSTWTVSVDAPKICRHGDALSHFTKPATATFTAERRGLEILLDGDRPTPVIGDYSIGEDVEQAHAEAIEFKDVGPYRIGYIAEGPEPIWIWKNGALEGREVVATDTHHLEIALLERTSNRIVMNAKVQMTMVPKAGGTPVSFEMPNLLSAFAHYGHTLSVKPGAYTLEVKVDPPPYATFKAEKPFTSVKTSFAWSGKRKAEMSETALAKP